MPEQSKRLPASARKEAVNIPNEVVIVGDNMLTELPESLASSLQERQGEAGDGDGLPAVPGNLKSWKRRSTQRFPIMEKAPTTYYYYYTVKDLVGAFNQE